MVSHRDSRPEQGSKEVLILIVMDNGLSRLKALLTGCKTLGVLILIVMDNGLSLALNNNNKAKAKKGLNPYCNG